MSQLRIIAFGADSLSASSTLFCINDEVFPIGVCSIAARSPRWKRVIGIQWHCGQNEIYLIKFIYGHLKYYLGHYRIRTRPSATRPCTYFPFQAIHIRSFWVTMLYIKWPSNPPVATSSMTPCPTHSNTSNGINSSVVQRFFPFSSRTSSLVRILAARPVSIGDCSNISAFRWFFSIIKIVPTLSFPITRSMSTPRVTRNQCSQHWPSSKSIYWLKNRRINNPFQYLCFLY